MRLSISISRLHNALGRRYVIERELGQGGMGAVYLARDRKHDRQVALKILPPDLATALGPERFLREIGIVARLAHPHILPLHDSGQAGGLLYYVMPYVEGESLRDRLSRTNQLPVDEAIAIIDQIAEALDYAHGHGVIHRDVKPANILLSSDGQALLADFGVARAKRNDSELITEAGLPIGTQGYMSPEQAAGSAEVDGRSDIYSLGCVLYEMLAGTREAEPILAQRFSQSPLPLTQLCPTLRPAIDQAVTQAMALLPADRFARATHLAVALHQEKGRKPGPTHIPPRRARWIVAAAITGLGLAAAGAFAFLPRETTLSAKRVLIARFTNRTGNDAFAPLGDIGTDYIARGLAATRLLDEVFDARTEPLDSGPQAGAAGGIRRLAMSMGAGTIVWGNYYRLGDSVHFEAQILDARSGKLLLSLQPVAGPLDAPTRVVETLRQRIMAGFGVIFGSGFETWQDQSVPPTYEAYQEMLAGDTAGWNFDFSAAAEHYMRAAALDRSYTGAQTSAVLLLAEAGRCREVDSLAAILAPSVSRLPPVDLGQFNWGVATCRGDFEATLEAGKRVLEVAPRSINFTVLTAIRAAELFRPHEVIAILQKLHPDPKEFVGGQEELYWTALASAYHQLGDHDQELALARSQFRRISGESPPQEEAVALAAMGRKDQVEPLVAYWLDREDPAGGAWIGARAECAALELRAHGQQEAAQRLLERTAAWFNAHPPEITTTEAIPPCLWHLLSAEYYAGRWGAARSSYEALARDTANATARFGLGAVAAREGRHEDVVKMDQWLEAHRDSYARARLAAIQGDRPRAVALIRRAFDQSLIGRMYMHIDPDLDSLHGYPPYEELVRPRE